MITHKQLKDDLMIRMGVAQSTLYKKASDIREHLDMEADEAVYLLALNNGMKLKRYVDNETLKRVRNLQRDYNRLAVASREPSQGSSKKPKRSPANTLIQMPSGTVIDDPLLSSSIKQDARRMAAIYPYFYYLENSIRSFVCAAMKKYYGNNWWENQVKKSLRDKVIALRKKEIKNMWHQKRGDREVDYLDFKELKNIYSKARAHLVSDGIFSKESWLDHLIDEVYESRCVVAHMNPLDNDNVAAVKVRVKQWNKLVKAKYREFKD
jgi:hypothetical protein